MSATVRSRGTRVGRLLCIAALLGGCAPSPFQTPAAEPAHEQMPAPASVWLTADPASPVQPVKVEMSSLEDPAFRRQHTFVAGEALRGIFPVSSGRYRLTGLDGACVIDVILGASREADVVIQIVSGADCAFDLVAEHGYDGITHEEPAVLVAP